MVLDLRERRRAGLQAEGTFDDGGRLQDLRQQRDALVERLELNDGPQEAVALDVEAPEVVLPMPDLELGPAAAPGLELGA